MDDGQVAAGNHGHDRQVAVRSYAVACLYKGKGAVTECDSHRGLLVSDHIGKVFTSIRQEDLNERYVQQIGDVQFGAVGLRSTALASLLLRTFLDLCRIFCLVFAHSLH